MNERPSTNPTTSRPPRADPPGAPPAHLAHHGLPSELRGQTVLVTGARGFLGRHLVRRLLADGAVVHATSRGPRVSESDAVVRTAPGPTWHSCDVSDPDQVDDLITRIQPQVVFHLASRVEGHREHALALPMLEANTRAAVAVMTAAQGQPGCRVVLAGSVEEPRDEAAPCSPYAAAKAAATGYARLFASQWDLPVTVLRIAMVYGPDQPDTTKLVPYVIDCFLRGRQPQLGSGTRLVDWVYIDDVIDAFVQAAREPQAPGVVADIGTGEGHTIAEVVRTLARLTGHDRPVHFGERDDRRHDVAHLADPGLAVTALNWRPRTGLSEGLARTVNWRRSLLDLESHQLTG